MIRPDRAVLRVFGWTTALVDWAFLIVGIVGAVGTLVGMLPPFGGGTLWAKVTNALLWLVLARQGYDSLTADDD